MSLGAWFWFTVDRALIVWFIPEPGELVGLPEDRTARMTTGYGPEEGDHGANRDRP